MLLLLQIKELRGVHFYDIVPLDDMLSRLVEDARRPAVCVALTDLLLNSFFPSKEDVCGAGAGAGAQDAVAGLAESRIESIDALLGSDQKLLRCLRFVEANPLAAEVFYAHLHRFVAFGSTANLCQKIFCIAVSSLPNAAADNQKGTGKRSRNHKVSIYVKLCMLNILYSISNIFHLIES